MKIVVNAELAAPLSKARESIGSPYVVQRLRPGLAPATNAPMIASITHR